MTLSQNIRDLCSRATAAEEPEEVEKILTELRAALREHTIRLKMMLARYPVPSDRLVRSGAPLVSDYEQSGPKS
jgi:hypothetical protein